MKKSFDFIIPFFIKKRNQFKLSQTMTHHPTTTKVYQRTVHCFRKKKKNCTLKSNSKNKRPPMEKHVAADSNVQQACWINSLEGICFVEMQICEETHKQALNLEHIKTKPADHQTR
jgi:hypothetical protein